MRGVLLACVVAVAGCGRKPAEPTGAETPPRAVAAEPTRKAEPVAAPVAEPVVGSVSWGDVFNSYKANELAADAKYRGKRVAVTVNPITHIGRNSKGLPYLGTEHFNYASEPMGVFVFTDDQSDGIAALKLRQPTPVRVEGVCEGKTVDGIPRGRLIGYEWHVKFRDCRLLP